MKSHSLNLTARLQVLRVIPLLVQSLDSRRISDIALAELSNLLKLFNRS